MISFSFDKDVLFTDTRLHSEWLETNGLGGWSGSTIMGCNTRRYHGLLVAATRPPSDRMVMVSKMDETIVAGGERFQLGTNDFGDVIHPHGYTFLRSFTRDIFPEFVFEAGGITLRKTVLMVHGENTTLIKYEVLFAEEPCNIEFLPLLAGRGYHHLLHAGEELKAPVFFDKDELHVSWLRDVPELVIQFPGAEFYPNSDWYYHFQYDQEKARGLDDREDLYTPGHFMINARQGDTFYLVLSTENKKMQAAALLFDQEVERRRQLFADEPEPVVQQLLLAADQFIVKRELPSATVDQNSEGATIIAGYHWFTDWSRDTMISLPGLCLFANRLEDAKKILSVFAESVSQGMLPNRFQDNGEPPAYNNVDGTLWYFIAIHHYLQASSDRRFVLNELLPVLQNIIDWHFKGTRYGIRVDDDGLLSAGETGYQLTWMDAKIGDWVVTPRMGKPVEIQALWYNALLIFGSLLQENGQTKMAGTMKAHARRTKKSFTARFWNESAGCLFDLIDQSDQPDASLRPNQLFAVSLPYPLVEGGKAKSIIQIIEEKLYTPRGLRTLSPEDERYVGRYEGDLWHRDASYHQGTVWSWLLGPYIDALFKTHRPAVASAKAGSIIQNFLPHLQEAGVGTISEIFDGDPLHTARGCIAQAWSVAEILRVVKTYRLLDEEK
jgi:predicted glycogen debranching enzyme